MVPVFSGHCHRSVHISGSQRNDLAMNSKNIKQTFYPSREHKKCTEVNTVDNWCTLKSHSQQTRLPDLSRDHFFTGDLGECFLFFDSVFRIFFGCPPQNIDRVGFNGQKSASPTGLHSFNAIKLRQGRWCAQGSDMNPQSTDWSGSTTTCHSDYSMLHIPSLSPEWTRLL